MKKLFLLLLIVPFVLVIFVGCKKVGPAVYTGVETGVIGGGQFTTDYGLTLRIDSNEGSFDVQTERRVMVSYETIPEENGSVSAIGIRQLWECTVVPPVPAATIPEDAADAPVELTSLWFSRGYLNMLANFSETKPAPGSFSAAYSFDPNGTILRFRHDDSDDTAASTRNNLVFLSLPLSEPILDFDQNCLQLGQTPVSPVPIIFQWTWYLQQGGEPTLIQREGSYDPQAW